MTKILQVSCPRCGKKTEYSPDNIYRPFCSERCKVIDLGDWASENFRIPVEPESKDVSLQNEDTQAPHEDQE